MPAKNLLLITIMIMLISACSETSTRTPTPVLPSSTANPAVQAAIENLIEREQYDRTVIEVIYIEPVVWQDNCLGLPFNNEVCESLETPGFKIILEAAGQFDHEYHTNEDGSDLRYFQWPEG
jgi:hypothetical protein